MGARCLKHYAQASEQQQDLRGVFTSEGKTYTEKPGTLAMWHELSTKQALCPGYIGKHISHILTHCHDFLNHIQPTFPE